MNWKNLLLKAAPIAIPAIGMWVIFRDKLPWAIALAIVSYGIGVYHTWTKGERTVAKKG